MSRNGVGKRDALLIAQLAAGVSHEKAAAACGCCANIISRRLRDPAFRAALADARQQLFENAFSQVLAASLDLLCQAGSHRQGKAHHPEAQLLCAHQLCKGTARRGLL